MWNPLDYFTQYYGDETFNILAKQTNIQGMKTFSKELKTDANEMKKFIGAHIAMGCFRLPRLRLYYNRSLKVPIVTQLPRNRMYLLRNNLHAVNNLEVSEEEKSSNKLWKVKPILEKFRSTILSLPKPKHCAIDEQMIPFSGKTSLRQYVPNKPNPTGLKNFVLAAPTGLVLDFLIYQGSTTFPDGHPTPGLGIGGTVVKILAVSVNPNTILYTDRYFTSINLMDKLLKQSLYLTGTVMANRIGNAKLKLMKDNMFKKKGKREPSGTGSRR